MAVWGLLVHSNFLCLFNAQKLTNNVQFLIVCMKQDGDRGNNTEIHSLKLQS